VVLHGVLRDEQLLGDVAVVHAARYQAEHLHLAVGQLRRGRVLGRLILGVPAGQGRELSEQLAGHRRVDEGLAAVDGANRVGELVKRDVLEQVAARTGADRLEEILFLVADRQHHDLGGRGDLFHLAGGLDAGDLRHPDVHEHDVGGDLAGDLHGLRAVGGLADKLKAGFPLQDHLKSPAEKGMVIRDQHPDRVGSRNRIGSRNGIAAGSQRSGKRGGRRGNDGHTLPGRKRPFGHGRSFRSVHSSRTG
jgi:hypothetical protein